MLRLRYAVLDEYSVLILSLRDVLGSDGHTGMGITPSQECCFYRRSGGLANSEHVDMARAPCYDVLVLGWYYCTTRCWFLTLVRYTPIA